MKISKGLLFLLVFLAGTFGTAFSYEIIDYNFPYKRLVYDGLGLEYEQWADVDIQEDEVYYLGFFYEGVYYSCDLLIYGAIIVRSYESDSSDQDDFLDAWLLCFDVESFRMATIGF